MCNIQSYESVEKIDPRHLLARRDWKPLKIIQVSSGNRAACMVLAQIFESRGRPKQSAKRIKKGPSAIISADLKGGYMFPVFWDQYMNRFDVYISLCRTAMSGKNSLPIRPGQTGHMFSLTRLA